MAPSALTDMRDERWYLTHGLWWVSVFIIRFFVIHNICEINFVLRMNLFRLVHFENYQRGSLAAIRYATSERVETL
jgi:hypothetical protein